MTKPVKPTLADRVVSYFAPVRAMHRLHARATMAFYDDYTGASKRRRTLKGFQPHGHDADSAINPQLDILRQRSSWMLRNNPLAIGAINTVCTNAVGTGLRLQCRIDRTVLGIEDGSASTWESDTEQKWRMFAESKECDIGRTLNIYAQQEMVLRSTLEKGDVFAGFVHREQPGSMFGLKIQLIESERISNPSNQQDTRTLSSGVEKDKYGAPTAYHVLNQHPGNTQSYKTRAWTKVPAFNPKTGRRIFLHIYRPTRPGQTRGVPYLAPVIEVLLQMGKYTENEARAAVISSLFTVFVRTPTGEGIGTITPADTKDAQPVTSNEQEVKLEGGTMVDLRPGEDVEFANPSRPNVAFDAFILALSRQVGTALELPYEILIKHFTASYSAARGALLEAWKFYKVRRFWLVQEFCQPVYEAWMDEAVANGIIAAPGYFENPFARAAWLGSKWEGPSMPQIDPLKEVKASREKIAAGISTIQGETANLNDGADWEKNHAQSVKEYQARKEAGLIAEPPAPDTAGMQQMDAGTHPDMGES